MIFCGWKIPFPHAMTSTADDRHLLIAMLCWHTCELICEISISLQHCNGGGVEGISTQNFLLSKKHLLWYSEAVFFQRNALHSFTHLMCSTVLLTDFELTSPPPDFPSHRYCLLPFSLRISVAQKWKSKQWKHVWKLFMAKECKYKPPTENPQMSQSFVIQSFMHSVESATRKNFLFSVFKQKILFHFLFFKCPSILLHLLRSIGGFIGFSLFSDL